MNKIRIGTRGSRLALIQAKLVQEAIAGADAGIETELVIVQTKGDTVQDKPLSEIGDKGVFASALEQALLAGQIDLAVHSAKDLPMRIAQGLVVESVLPRADVREMLVVKRDAVLPVSRTKAADGGGEKSFRPNEEAEEDGSITGRRFLLGTGSKRRQLQAQVYWKNVDCRLIRGNVDTRLQKLRNGMYDGILLAKAGLDRLGIGFGTEDEFDFYPMPARQFLPAACQGILAAEYREEWEFGEMLSQLSDFGTELDFCVEREVLRLLGVDCSEAVAAWCRETDDGLCLDVMYGGHKIWIQTKERSRQAGLLAAKEATERVRAEWKQDM